MSDLIDEPVGNVMHVAEPTTVSVCVALIEEIGAHAEKIGFMAYEPPSLCVYNGGRIELQWLDEPVWIAVSIDDSGPYIAYRRRARNGFVHSELIVPSTPEALAEECLRLVTETGREAIPQAIPGSDLPPGACDSG